MNDKKRLYKKHRKDITIECHAIKHAVKEEAHVCLKITEPRNGKAVPCSVELCRQTVDSLIERCGKILFHDCLSIDDAHSFATQDNPRSLRYDLAFNIISSNAVSDVEAFYYDLKTLSAQYYAKQLDDEGFCSEPSFDATWDFLPSEADDICKYMDRLQQFLLLHDSCSAMKVFAKKTSENQRGPAISLTVKYQACNKDGFQKQKRLFPWTISLRTYSKENTRKGDKPFCFSFSDTEFKSLLVSLCHEDVRHILEAIPIHSQQKTAT